MFKSALILAPKKSPLSMLADIQAFNSQYLQIWCFVSFQSFRPSFSKFTEVVFFSPASHFLKCKGGNHCYNSNNNKLGGLYE